MRYVNQYQHREAVSPEDLDRLLAEGWRHFGTTFFRYSLIETQGRLRRVIPLRIRLGEFHLTRSQRRIRARNRDLEVRIGPTLISPTIESLFQQHKARFTDNIPDSIHDFLSEQPATVPCRNHQLSLYQGDRLLAASFLDLGATAASAVYAIFDLAESRRSLGIELILAGVEYARARGMVYYYPGYAYRGPSIYDYKKRFAGLEAYDWKGRWLSYREEEE
ncbi:MAG: arginine-tRNA-protein transferase [Blastocatellia bacterium]|jgi:arginine-tRNA-protein transferase